MRTSLNGYFTEWVHHWMSTSLNEYFTESVLHRMTTSLNEYFNERVFHWLSTLLNEYFTEWLLHWMSTSLNEYITFPLRLWPGNMQHFETKTKTLKSSVTCILWSFFNNFTFYFYCFFSTWLLLRTGNSYWVVKNI